MAENREFFMTLLTNFININSENWEIGQVAKICYIVYTFNLTALDGWQKGRNIKFDYHTKGTKVMK